MQNYTQAAFQGNGPSGVGQKTNRAQGVVRGSQGQLDVSAPCTREQGPGSDTEQGRSSRPRRGRGGSQPRGTQDSRRQGWEGWGLSRAARLLT